MIILLLTGLNEISISGLRKAPISQKCWLIFPPRIDSKNPFSNDPLRRLEGSPQKRKTNNTKIIWGIIAGCNLKVARFSGSHNFPEN